MHTKVVFICEDYLAEKNIINLCLSQRLFLVTLVDGTSAMQILG